MNLLCYLATNSARTMCLNRYRVPLQTGFNPVYLYWLTYSCDCVALCVPSPKSDLVEGETLTDGLVSFSRHTGCSRHTVAVCDIVSDTVHSCLLMCLRPPMPGANFVVCSHVHGWNAGAVLHTHHSKRARTANLPMRSVQHFSNCDSTANYHIPRFVVPVSSSVCID